MKIRVALKDLDSMQDAVAEAYERAEKPEGIDADEWVDIRAERVRKAADGISDKWMPYGEYLYVEFDTEAGTATVLPASEFK